MSTQPNTLLTPEQYLEIERAAEFKSEYFDGQVFAMAGTTAVHNIIAINAITTLRNGFRGRNCRVFSSDLRVCNSPPRGPYVYPDISAVCGERKFLDGVLDTLINPTLIIEVLSPSTEAYDRGRKFERYKRVQSLEQYVLVASDRVHVDLFSRQPDGAWKLTSASNRDDEVQLVSVGCALAVTALYEDTGLI